MTALTLDMLSTVLSRCLTHFASTVLTWLVVGALALLAYSIILARSWSGGLKETALQKTGRMDWIRWTGSEVLRSGSQAEQLRILCANVICLHRSPGPHLAP